MRTALEQLRAYHERPRRFPNLATTLVAALTAFTAASAVFTWGEHTEGTPLPIALSVLPVAYLALLVLTLQPSSRRKNPEVTIETRATRPDGWTELTLRPRRPFRLKLAMGLFLGGAFYVLCFLIVGLLAAAAQSEALARETLRESLQELIPCVPIALLLLVIPLRTCIGWDHVRVRLHGREFDRAAIRRVAIMPSGDLQLRVDGRRRPVVLREEVIWTAGVLETLGYEIEFDPAT